MKDFLPKNFLSEQIIRQTMSLIIKQIEKELNAKKIFFANFLTDCIIACTWIKQFAGMF